MSEYNLDRLLEVVEWLEMATTDPTVPSCVIQSEIDDYGAQLRSVYEELKQRESAVAPVEVRGPVYGEKRDDLIFREVCGAVGPRTSEGAPRCVKPPHESHEKHRADESWEHALGQGWMEW